MTVHIVRSNEEAELATSSASFRSRSIVFSFRAFVLVYLPIGTAKPKCRSTPFMSDLNKLLIIDPEPM